MVFGKTFRLHTKKKNQSNKKNEVELNSFGGSMKEWKIVAVFQLIIIALIVGYLMKQCIFDSQIKSTDICQISEFFIQTLRPPIKNWPDLEKQS